MFILEPLLSLLLLCLILHKENHCLRHSVLSAAVVWAVLLVAMTEVLSLFRSLTFSWVSGLWGIVSLILCFISLHWAPQGREDIAYVQASAPLDVPHCRHCWINRLGSSA
jgi:hypothetical protein